MAQRTEYENINSGSQYDKDFNKKFAIDITDKKNKK